MAEGIFRGIWFFWFSIFFRGVGDRGQQQRSWFSPSTTYVPGIKLWFSDSVTSTCTHPAITTLDFQFFNRFRAKRPDLKHLEKWIVTFALHNEMHRKLKWIQEWAEEPVGGWCVIKQAEQVWIMESVCSLKVLQLFYLNESILATGWR